jgi:hypothetical protein
VIVVRQIFQAKYGHGDELVELFKEFFQAMSQRPQSGFRRNRILTDLSGPFFTIVTETDVESLAVWERGFGENMASGDFRDWFTRMQNVVESGSREYWTIQAEVGAG